MRRWLLTLALSSAAVAAAVLVPRFSTSIAVPVIAVPVIAVPPRSTISAETDGPLSFTARLDQAAFLAGADAARYLVLTAAAPADPGAGRLPIDLALVVDTSGSMGKDDKMENAREAAREVVERLGPEDRFALVSFDDHAHVLLRGAAFDGDRDRLLKVVDTLTDTGGTNLYEGLTEGRAQLGGSARSRRILVVSDGNPTVGEDAPSAFRSLVAGFAEDGATVSTLGLGADFNEVLLEGIADTGRGNYAYVQRSSELASVAAREFDDATQVVGQNLSLRVRLPDGVRPIEVHGWAWDREGDTLIVPMGEISAGQQRKVVIELQADGAAPGALHLADAELGYMGARTARAHSARLSVDAQVTTDTGLAAASRDEAANVAVSRARAGTLAKRSADAARAGNAPEAAAWQRSSEAVLFNQQVRLREVIDSVEGGEALDALLGADLDDNAAIAELNSRGDSNVAAKTAAAASRRMSK